MNAYGRGETVFADRWVRRAVAHLLLLWVVADAVKVVYDAITVKEGRILVRVLAVAHQRADHAGCRVSWQEDLRTHRRSDRPSRRHF